MGKVIKSVILSVMLILVFALPAFAATKPATDVTQQITNMRLLETTLTSTTPLSARIYNLTIELNIHKVKSEPDTVFKSKVQEMLVPLGSNSPLAARKFDCIALMAIYSWIDDDTAIEQLQELDAN